MGKQEELLKKVKESDEFFNCVGLIRPIIYFKICLHKCLCKFPTLKKSTPTSSYFKSNFTLTKTVCKTNVDIFGVKK